MPTAEARYVRMIGDYCLDVMPESPRRRDLVLNYITAKTAIRPALTRRLAMAAVLVAAAVAITLVVNDALEATPAPVSARVLETYSGQIVLIVTRDMPGRPSVTLYREVLTISEAIALMSTPDWAKLVITAHVRP